MISQKPFLTLSNINLSYGTQKALKNISITINNMETHAIVGEHGAGKSSLALVTSGFLKPHSGRIILDGRSFDFLTQEEARNNGIEIVTQHNPLFEHFTVADNIMISDKTDRSPFFSEFHSVRKANEYLKKLNLNLNPAAILKNLNLSDKVLVDILKHLFPNPKLLILDEALEKLSSETLRKILTILNNLKSSGLSILYITHRIDDIYNFADKVTIIRDGEFLITDSVENIDKITLITLAYTQIMKEEKIKADQAFYQIMKYNEAILTNLPVNLIVIDKENRLRLVNESAKNLFNFENNQYKNITLKRLFSNYNEKILSLIQEAISKEQQMSFYQVPLYEHNIKTVNNLKIYPIFDGTFLIGNIIIIEDITEQENLREQVILSENLASVGLLAAGVAHEINNPLDIISYYLQHIRFNSSDSTVIKAIDSIDEEVSSIAQIVGNLITFSDRKKATVELFNINDLIKNLIDLIEYNAKKSNISISFEKNQEIINIEANKNEIKQVILNLIKNSFESMPEGGNLSIATYVSEKQIPQVVEIIFNDTGIGIEEKNLQNIFLPFFSTKNDMDRNTGLGLSISYWLIKKYKGSISVKNRDSSGCQFKMTLPLLTHG